jgi:hypothetical protein
VVAEVPSRRRTGMDYCDAVKQLVKWHRESPQPPEKIILFPDPEEKEIRLIEVTDLLPKTSESQVYPIKFGPTTELPYDTIVAQVTPSEWQDICHGLLALPEGWDLRTSREIMAEVEA